MSTITPEVVPSNPGHTPPSYFFPMDLGTYLLATVKGKIGTNAVQKNSWQMNNHRMDENIGGVRCVY